MSTSRPTTSAARPAIRLLAWFLVVLLLVVGAVAFFASSPFTRDMRVQLVSGYLSDLMGQPVVIDGDASLNLLGSPSLSVSKLRIPSENMAGTDLAYLEHARFALAIPGRFFGGTPLPAIDASGLTVLLLQDAEGQTSWTKLKQTSGPQGDVELLPFLAARDVTFSDMSLRVEELGTGFEFDFYLGDMRIRQDRADGRLVRVTSQGTINEQAFEASAQFPQAAPFDFGGNIGALTFALQGEPLPDGGPAAFSADLTMQSPDLEEVLETLRLEGDFRGTGEAAARLYRTDGALALEGIDLTMDFIDGERIWVSGRAKGRQAGPDFDLRLRYQRFPDGQGPEEAVFLEELQLSGVDLHVVGDGESIEIENVYVETNAFDEELQNIGPFGVKDVRRTSDNRLELNGLTFSIGPEDAPIIVAEGDIANLLALEGYSLRGSLDLPANWVLLTLRDEEAAAFGRATGSLEILETDGRAELREFRIQSEGSDLWQGSLNATSRDLIKLEDVELEASLGTEDGVRFLEAIQLEPVDTGPIEAFLSAERTRSKLEADARLTIGSSVVGMDLDMRIRQQSPVLRGSIRSEQIRLSDFQNALLAALEVGRAPVVWEDIRSSVRTGEKSVGDDFKPLVLEETSEPEQAEEEIDLSEFQPLVIDRSPPAEDDLSEFKPLVVEAPSVTEAAGDEFKPLVVNNGVGNLSFEMFRNPDEFLKLLDLEIAIDVPKLTGQEGISSIRSDAIMKDGRLDFGPLTFAYGGGFITGQAALDVVSAPDWLRVTGRTGGWDVSDVLTSLGAEPSAAGTLTGQFDITGRYAPLESFPDTMSGRVTVEMEQGRINSSLVELVGLGVVPWLFSRELQQGWTNIVCLRAPLFIDSGRIRTEDTVLETERVQIVAEGVVDVAKGTLNLRGDPRPVGRPLSRSPWPISITGALDAPDVSIASRRGWRAREPLSMPDNRKPCVPDVSQLERQPEDEG